MNSLASSCSNTVLTLIHRMILAISNYRFYTIKPAMQVSVGFSHRLKLQLGAHSPGCEQCEDPAHRLCSHIHTTAGQARGWHNEWSAVAAPSQAGVGSAGPSSRLRKTGIR